MTTYTVIDQQGELRAGPGLSLKEAAIEVLLSDGRHYMRDQAMTIYATRDADEGSDIIVTAIEPGSYGARWFKTLKVPEPRPDVLVAVGRLREECL